MSFFTHKIALIERTKLLEGVYCQSLAFTNNLQSIFPESQTESSAITNITTKVLLTSPSTDAKWQNVFENIGYTTPIQSGEISILTPRYISTLIKQTATLTNVYSTYTTECTAYIQVDGEEINIDNVSTETYTLQVNEILNIQYKVTANFYVYNGDETIPFIGKDRGSVSFVIGARGNLNNYPTKPWTITSGINRVLDLAEPLYLGDTPRFALNPIQAQKWENTPLPETTMTQCTLREQLQHIGNYVHAQARLGGYLTESVTYNDVEYAPGYYDNMIFFDEYGQEEESTLQGKLYVSNQIRHSINEYNTQIDTTAQNIVNTLDYGDGVVVSPDAMHYKTLRTEGINIKVTDNEGNGFIATELPIYDIISVKCKAFNSDGTVFAENLDITPFIFEAHEYNSVLSSYGGGYPYSKSYAIYYSQGEKNIKGLFFKATTEPSDILGDYVSNFSIVNILEAVAPSYAWKNYVTSKFPYLAFQVSYIPFFETRYSHTDGYVSGQDRKMPYTKIYNQSENVIEARFYGENIKGVAKRLGNQETTRTYYLSSINNVAKVGTMLDGYYISQAVTEYMPQSIRCTVGLTKNFNRLSQNIGINSTKRVAEVSERQAYNRNILLKEYICIGGYQELPFKPSKLQENVNSTLDMIIGVEPSGEGTTPNPDRLPNSYLLTVADIRYQRKTKSNISQVKAPIVSSAFGNCMTFSWKMKDNYSAGEKITELDKGYWQRDVAYSDYYGRAYLLDFMLTDAISGENELDSAMDVSITQQIGRYKRGGLGTRRILEADTHPYVLRKDSREIINVNVAIEYITDRQDLILGSALASCNPWVSNSKRDANGNIIKPKIYYLNKKVNAYEKTVSLADVVARDSFPPTSSSTVSVITYSNVLKNTNYKSWVIAYEPTSETQMVYNEDTGEEEEITIYSGGEILIACNNGIDYYTPSNPQQEFEIDILYIKAYSDKMKEYESD
jgi:hypothetical protein